MTKGNLSFKSLHISQESGFGEYTLGKANLNYFVVGELRIITWELFVFLSCQCPWTSLLAITPHLTFIHEEIR